MELFIAIILFCDIAKNRPDETKEQCTIEMTKCVDKTDGGSKHRFSTCVLKREVKEKESNEK
jgi:hypothetical protein